MTDAEIKAYLTIVELGNISRAAERLFISQSSLSTKIKILEAELGYPLFFRGQGQRGIVLTEKGRQFYPLAVKYEKIVRQMYGLRDKNAAPRLRVASLNSIGTYVLPPVYEKFIQALPDVMLEAQDVSSDVAYSQLENGETDLALTVTLKHSKQVKAESAFSEPLVIVSSADLKFQEPVTLEELDTQKELYENWTDGYETWYEETFRDCPPPRIHLPMAGQIQRFLTDRSCWAIVPVSVAIGIKGDGNIHQYKAGFPIPRRTVYCLCTGDAASRPGYNFFMQCLKERLLEMAQDGVSIHKEFFDVNIQGDS